MKVYGIIYKITNNLDGKVYIGKTKNSFKQRYHYGGNSSIERVYNFLLYRESRNQYFNVRLLESICINGLDAFEVIDKFDVAYSKVELEKKKDIGLIIIIQLIGEKDII